MNPHLDEQRRARRRTTMAKRIAARVQRAAALLDEAAAMGTNYYFQHSARVHDYHTEETIARAADLTRLANETIRRG